MKWTRLIAVLFLLALSLPNSGSSQEITWTYRPGSEGWIGFWYNYSKATVEGREQTVVVVTEIAEGSPAEAYGIAVGDIITHLDGQPISQKVFSSMSEALEPGDLVRMVLRRDGRPREITVEAASPPARVMVSPNTERIVVELEALSGNILKSMDSLRVSLSGLNVDEADRRATLQVLRIPSDSARDEDRQSFGFRLQQAFSDPLVFGPEAFYIAPDMALPFEAMVVESRATAPLKEELAQLRKELTTVRRNEFVRRRELAAAVPGSIEEALKQDQRMRELQAAEAQLLSRQDQLTAHLRDVSEVEMQRHWVEIQSRSEEAFVEARRAQEDAVARARREGRDERTNQEWSQYEYTYRSPVIVGQSFFMGAQTAPLNSELAEYFLVEKGVFVIQVVEGSPASEAGLQGGDVIVAVAGEEVSTLSDLRFNLSAFDGPIQIRVVRKGEPLQIVIRR